MIEKNKDNILDKEEVETYFKMTSRNAIINDNNSKSF
jgi:hypothetical protein